MTSQCPQKREAERELTQTEEATMHLGLEAEVGGRGQQLRNARRLPSHSRRDSFPVTGSGGSWAGALMCPVGTDFRLWHRQGREKIKFFCSKPPSLVIWGRSLRKLHGARGVYPTAGRFRLGLKGQLGRPWGGH